MMTPPPEHQDSPSSPSLSSSKKESKASSSSTSALEESTARTAEAAAALSRENFLRRLESQQQQQQRQKSSETCNIDNENVDEEGYIGLLNIQEERMPLSPPPAADDADTTKLRVAHSPPIGKNNNHEDGDGGQDKDDRLLIDYLSQYYCQPSSLSPSHPSSIISLPLLPPACWIQDIDPSSREFLESLAANSSGSGTGGGGGALDRHHFCTPTTTSIIHPTADAADDAESSTANYEVGGSIIHKQRDHGGAGPNNRSRFSNDPSKSSSKEEDCDKDDGIPPAAAPTYAKVNIIQPSVVLPSLAAAAASSTSSSLSVPPPPPGATEEERNQPQEEQQQRLLLLSILENQQRQMHELQIRLDAMGSMMARMEADVRRLRDDARQKSPRGRRHEQMEERLRNLFLPGFGIRREGGGGGMFGMGRPPPRQQPQQQRQREAAAMPPPPNPAAARAPADDDNNNENNHPIVILLRNHMQHHPPRGIFFPLLVAVVRSLAALPHRLRTMLQSTGPGRVYAHVRRRALELRAFDNVDLGSLMKLLIMLLIFTGRGRSGSSSSSTGGARGQKRNVRGGGDGRDGAAGAGDDDAIIPFDMYSLFQWIIEYWNGHRMHILMLSSLIGYLIQVGLMSFLYKVLWLEREDVWKAWMGPKEEEETEANNEVQGGERDAADENHADVVVGGGNRANGIAANNPAGNVVAGPVVEPLAAARAIIRRGPNNGGFLYDVQCLILSFLLSLIPAWFPEAIPEPAVEVEERLPQQI